ncbi:MAG: HEAT repeat domain-containing protein [Bacteroidota bacterium]
MRRLFQSFTLFSLISLILIGFSCKSDQEFVQQPPVKLIELDAAEAAQQAKDIRQQISAELADGLELNLWASDSLAPDPIAMSIDEQGKVYLTRTNRQKHCEFDIRGHRDWMTQSISFQSVEDRRQFLRQEFSPLHSEENSWLPDMNEDGVHDWMDLRVVKEDVYCLQDVSGDGVADQAHIYTSDFSEEITDCAGAILAYNDEVFVGVGPDLWRLQDQNQDGMADTKTSISHGYAVHIGFGAHGMSGLTVGPDGKIYWSIGDIGMNVVDQTGKRWAYPNQGVIVRANPDGSDFEVFAAGLRNTHEFVFDKYGNLISVDNDGDHPGEKERIVYVVEGSDSGWRTNWQFGKYTDPDNNLYKVWMDEEFYKPRFAGQAAHITPCILNYHSGPTGMLYNPGTALGEKWKDKFFVVEFTGTAARSFVHAFELSPKGASFEFAGEEKVLGGVLPTGIEFGPDGAMYVADWIDGWGVKKYGRVWKLDSQEKSAIREETESLIRTAFADKQASDLSQLLHHADMRVRQKAQFELAKRGDNSPLLAAIKQTEHQLARVHGIWGIAQLARKRASEAEALIPLLKDPDPEIRAQAAKWLGDVRYQQAGAALVPVLADQEARVRFFAAEALGRIAYVPATQALIGMLESNDDQDAYLRHAGALALARMGDPAPLTALASHPSRALRIAAVVALRRLRDPGVAIFLQDKDEYIVTEAARAINDDYSIEEALPALARVLADTRFTSEPLLRRAINACLRVGGKEQIELLTNFIDRTSASNDMRVDAIGVLATWANPSVLDRVDGRYRGPVRRRATEARRSLLPVFSSLIETDVDTIRFALAKAAGRLNMRETSPDLLSLMKNNQNRSSGSAAFEALAQLATPELSEALELAMKGKNPNIRMKALELMPELDLESGQQGELLAYVLDRGSMEEQQIALQTLGKIPPSISGTLMERSLARLKSGRLKAALRLDLVEAIESAGSDELKTELKAYQDALAATDPLAPYRDALNGGDARVGGQIFYQNSAAQCVRCHSLNGYGGDTGPVLDGVGKAMNREKILESLVEPNAQIATGFGVVTLTLKDGEKHVGILREETPNMMILKTEEAEPLKIPKAKIARTQYAPSAMPPMGLVLSKRELRDVIEFLANM